MATRTQLLFLISGGLLLAFGLGFLLAPAFVLGTYGVELDDSGERLVRMFGAAVFALAVVSGTAARSASPLASSAAARGMFAFFSVKAAVSLEALLGGMFNALGFSILAIDVPLALLWAHQLWRERAGRPVATLTRPG